MIVSSFSHDTGRIRIFCSRKLEYDYHLEFQFFSQTIQNLLYSGGQVPHTAKTISVVAVAHTGSFMLRHVHIVAFRNSQKVTLSCSSHPFLSLTSGAPLGKLHQLYKSTKRKFQTQSRLKRKWRVQKCLKNQGKDERAQVHVKVFH